MRSEGWKSICCLSKATPARPYACRFSSLRRWIKPSVGPLLHARVSPACTADSSLCRLRDLQFRLSILLHFFQPPPQPISLAMTQHMPTGLHLACRASQRLVGLDQPRPQDAERSCIFDGSTLAGSFNTRACPRTRVQTPSLSRKREAMKNALKPDCC